MENKQGTEKNRVLSKNIHVDRNQERWFLIPVCHQLSEAISLSHLSQVGAGVVPRTRIHA